MLIVYCLCDRKLFNACCLKKKNSIQNIIPPDDFLELADASYFDADSEAT